jgi:hypothetical protein
MYKKKPLPCAYVYLAPMSVGILIISLVIEKD